MAEEKESYWAWTGDEIIYLGAFETFNEADEETSKRGLCAVWLFCKEALERMLKQWQREALLASPPASWSALRKGLNDMPAEHVQKALDAQLTFQPSAEVDAFLRRTLDLALTSYISSHRCKKDLCDNGAKESS